MAHRLTPLLVVAAVALPASAAAQAGASAHLAAGARSAGGQVSADSILTSPRLKAAHTRLRSERLRPAPRILLTTPASSRLQSGAERETPEIKLRARSEWFDDQGLSLGLTKIAYRQRF